MSLSSSLVRWIVLAAALCGGGASPAQEPEPEDEMARHLAAIKVRLEDGTLDIAVREDLAFEMAGTLDRAARAEAKLKPRLDRWDAAVTLLDEFESKNPDHPRHREFSLQAAVYRWAQARAWHDRRSLFPAETGDVAKEAASLDDAIARLRKIVGGEAGVLTDNVRFRLAWALTDRAALEDPQAPTAVTRRSEAVDLLKQPPAESTLAGFHALLKAELLRLDGRLDEAAGLLEAAAKAPSPPPEAESLDVLVRTLLDQRRFPEARTKVDGSQLPTTGKDLHHVRIDLAELNALGVEASRESQRGIEEDLVRRFRSLKESNAPELRIALSESAAAVARFDPDASAELWDLLAQGLEIRGRFVEAADAVEKAASRAEKAGRRADAGAFRLRAGGFLFQAGRFADADAALDRVTSDPESGESRARASLLQALAKGRVGGGAEGLAGADYEKALRRHLQDFGEDPTAVEARWLLANLEHAKGARDQALELWKAVPADSPRWILARTAACDAYRRSLENRVSAEEREGLEAEYAEASAFVEESLLTARERPDADRAELLLRKASLNVVPIVGDPQRARAAAEQCLSMNLTPSQRYRARLAQTVAMAALGRYVDAEREAHQHPDWAVAAERDALLQAVRQLDLAANSAEADLPQRRFGLVSRLLIQPVLNDESLPDDMRSELTFRLARALLFQGDPQGARTTLQNWAPATRTADDRYLKDLADAYFRLDANELAVDVERLRVKNLAAGSHGWFDARYGLALAYYRLGRKAEARQLIEGTAILHPELGGGRLREKFIRLRQRLGSNP